jgi:hypothetical protein
MKYTVIDTSFIWKISLDYSFENSNHWIGMIISIFCYTNQKSQARKYTVVAQIRLIKKYKNLQMLNVSNR